MSSTIISLYYTIFLFYDNGNGRHFYNKELLIVSPYNTLLTSLYFQGYITAWFQFLQGGKN